MDGFDFGSFILGILAGLLAAIVLPVRERLMALLQAGQQQYQSGKQAVTRSADARYRMDLIKDCQTMHIAGGLVELADIIIEPSFLPAPELPDPESGTVSSVMHVVPLHHDMPHSYAPFNLETVAMEDLSTGGRRLAILGLPGAGKTTTLAAIALQALGELDFTTIAELSAAVEVAAEEDEEDEDLTDEERDAAEKRRLREEEIEQRALDHLRSLKLAEEVDEEDYTGPERLDWTDYTPMFIHLADIELDADILGDEVDPAEPLMRAIQRRVGAVTQRTIPRFIYKQAAEGRVLLLVDGYEEMPESMRDEKLAWLRHFLEVYPDNLVYMTGPATGYGTLLELGFTPVFVRPWDDQNSTALVEKWAAAWPEAAGTKKLPAPAPDERTLKRVMENNRSRMPLDISLKIWMNFATDGREVGRIGWYDAYVQRYFQMDEEHAEKGRRFVETMAARVLDTTGHNIPKDELRGAITQMFTVRETVTVKKKGEEIEEVKEEVTINVDDFIKGLTGDFRLMVERAGGLLTFRHPLLGAYLAAEAIAKDSARIPDDLLGKVAWRDAFPFMAARMNLDRAVVAHLSAQPDLLYSNLFEVASWLIDAPPSARWRGEVFKRLARALMAPNQYQTVRERALGAIIATRDENVLFIYRQALQSQAPKIRQLACLGMGALGTAEAIKDLMPMLSDESLDVQLAAGLALGAIRSERSLEVMVQGLLDGEENLRRAVAEALAALPGEGHDIIRDAAKHNDMMVRRAAVFGLRRIKASWALVDLYRVMLEDAEWYVRSAAQEAFAEARNPEVGALKGYPAVDSLQWLMSWAAERGSAVPAGEQAKQFLLRALQEGEAPVREAAAGTLALIGYLPSLKPLYMALRDPEDEVRDAAFGALARFQQNIGAPLPSVA